MTWLLIPRDASSSSANVWIGGLDEPQPTEPMQLRVGSDRLEIGPPWETWQTVDHRTRLRWQTKSVGNLPAGVRLGAALEIGSRQVAKANLTTLPDRFPLDRPLVVLLASCFAHRSDRGGRVGLAYTRLAPKPDFKTSSTMHPTGSYLVRQHSAAVALPGSYERGPSGKMPGGHTQATRPKRKR